MKIDEFNQINEKLIKQLNEEADPLTRAQDANDIKDSLKVKADKEEEKLKQIFYKLGPTDPSTKIGKIMRLNHKVQKVKTEDAINAKRKYNISSETGEHQKGIMEGLISMAKDIDMDIPNEVDNFFNNDEVTNEDQKDLREGFIENIKKHIREKKAKKASSQLSKVMKDKDDVDSDIIEAQKKYNALVDLIKLKGKESDKKKLDKVYDKLVDLDGKSKKIENQYNKLNDLVAGYEQQGLLEDIDITKLLEDVASIKNDAKEVIANLKSISDDNPENPAASNNPELEVPDELLQPTGDHAIDKTVSNIVTEINKEKTKQKPDIIKIKKLIQKIRTLREN